MIREDRLQLNERFIQVFRELEDRGVIKKNDRSGKGVGDVAERVLGNRSYGHIIRAFLDPSNKRVIDYGQARSFCRAYNINEEYIIEGMGHPFEDSAPKSDWMGDLTQLFGNGVGNILFTTVEAFAGSAVDVSSFSREQNTFFSLPGISGGQLVAFPIKGNSMEPVINDGDIVICREINSLQDIKENQIYAVKNGGNVWIKYVQKMMDKKGRVVKLKLLSANYLEHDPFEEEVNEYTRLYKVVRRISSL